jgi:hypothetical protein
VPAMRLVLQRKRARRLLKTPCTIHRRGTTTDDAGGGWTETPGATVQTVCLVQDRVGRTIVAGGETEQRIESILLLPTDVELHSGDIVKVQSDYGERTFVVEWAPPVTEAVAVQEIGANEYRRQQ